MADDIRDIRTLKEIKDHGGDFAAWLEDKGDEIDRFRGVTINKEKEQRLADMRTKCIELHKLDSGIAHTYSPFDRTNRHGTVLVTLPEVFASHDKRVTKILSELYAEADDVCFSSLGEGIRLSFSVLDMWDEYEYIDRAGGAAWRINTTSCLQKSTFRSTRMMTFRRRFAFLT